MKNGKGRDRTADTRIFSAVLYQLSYLAGSQPVAAGERVEWQRRMSSGYAEAANRRLHQAERNGAEGSQVHHGGGNDDCEVRLELNGRRRTCSSACRV